MGKRNISVIFWTMTFVGLYSAFEYGPKPGPFPPPEIPPWHHRPGPDLGYFPGPPNKCNLLPLVRLGMKSYYFETFFKTNWFQAFRYCRHLGLSLVAITSNEQNQHILTYINRTGYGKESFWTSGTDLGLEGKFYWMDTAVPVAYADWHLNEPDNHKHADGQLEHCLHYWYHGNEMKWNDARCSDENYFICEER